MVGSSRSPSGGHRSPLIKPESVYRRRFKAAIAAACVVAISAAGCSISHTVAGKPTTASPTTTSVTLPQSELLHDFVAEQDPMDVFKEGFYYLLRHPMATSVAITGYRRHRIRRL
jgi:hypothetical protein